MRSAKLRYFHHLDLNLKRNWKYLNSSSNQMVAPSIRIYIFFTLILPLLYVLYLHRKKNITLSLYLAGIQLRICQNFRKMSYTALRWHKIYWKNRGPLVLYRHFLTKCVTFLVNSIWFFFFKFWPIYQILYTEKIVFQSWHVAGIHFRTGQNFRKLSI